MRFIKKDNTAIAPGFVVLLVLAAGLVATVALTLVFYQPNVVQNITNPSPFSFFGQGTDSTGLLVMLALGGLFIYMITRKR